MLIDGGVGAPELHRETARLSIVEQVAARFGDFAAALLQVMPAAGYSTTARNGCAGRPVDARTPFVSDRNDRRGGVSGLLIWIGGGWVLNFAWEMAQRPLYCGTPGLLDHLLGCLMASLGDVVMLGYLFGLMAAVAGRWRWFSGPKLRLAGLCAAGFILAIATELRALFAGRWSYTEAMPLVPGFQVGWTPVLQMMLIPLLLALALRCRSGEP